MEIRPADPDDAEAIREVARESWGTDYPGIVSRETIPDTVEEWYDPDRLREEVETPGVVVPVAEAGGEVVGFAHAVVSTESWTGAILRLYVHPDHRREGIGTQLLEATVDRLRDRNAERIEAMVLADNEAGNEFYRAAGFEREDTGETVIGDEPHQEHRYVFRED